MDGNENTVKTPLAAYTRDALFLSNNLNTYHMRFNRNIIDHWHCRFEDLQMSTDDFYKAIEAILRVAELPDVDFGRLLLFQTNVFTATRVYLKVSYQEFNFLICAAPFGRNFFVSYWLREYWTLRSLFGYENRKTYYQIDAEIMFKESIIAIIKSAIGTIEQERGTRIALQETSALA